MSLLSLIFHSYIGHVTRMCVFTALQRYLFVLTDFSGVRNFPDKSSVTLNVCYLQSMHMSYSLLQTVSSTLYFAKIVRMVVSVTWYGRSGYHSWNTHLLQAGWSGNRVSGGDKSFHARPDQPWGQDTRSVSQG
jgi:hypothetical protein